MLGVLYESLKKIVFQKCWEKSLFMDDNKIKQIRIYNVSVFKVEKHTRSHTQYLRDMKLIFHINPCPREIIGIFVTIQLFIK